MDDLIAVVGNYVGKDGQQKAEFLKVGAVGTSQAGKQYIILNPEVNIAGALFKQNLANHAQGKPPQKSLMCSISNRQQQAPQQQGQQQQYQAPQQQQQVQQQQDLDSSIPF